MELNDEIIHHPGDSLRLGRSSLRGDDLELNQPPPSKTQPMSGWLGPVRHRRGRGARTIGSAPPPTLEKN